MVVGEVRGVEFCGSGLDWTARSRVCLGQKLIEPRMRAGSCEQRYTVTAGVGASLTTAL